MDDPKGLTFIGKSLFVTDKNRILKVEPNGKWTVFGSTMTFPQTPVFLNDITSDEEGNLYVSDSGNLKSGGAIYKITQNKKITIVLNENTPEILAYLALYSLSFSGFSSLHLFSTAWTLSLFFSLHAFRIAESFSLLCL